MPAFESADGACIAESNAIAWFVANEQLRGKTDAESAQVVQWMAFADAELLPAVCAWTFPMQVSPGGGALSQRGAVCLVPVELHVFLLHFIVDPWLSCY